MWIVSLLPNTQQLECKLPAFLSVRPHRIGSRTRKMNNYSCGLQGGWRLISCNSTASMPSCSQTGPQPRRSCPQLQSQHPSWLAMYQQYQQGKSIMLNVLPIAVWAARRKGKVFLLLLQQIRKEDKVCWRLFLWKACRRVFMCFFLHLLGGEENGFATCPVHMNRA